MNMRMLGVVSLLVCAACSSEAGSDDALVGVATASVLLAPTDVKCIVISVAGTTTVTQQFTATPEQNTVFALSGLPLGTDTFSAQAFGVACSALTGATATYVSTPATLAVTANSPVNVTFQMVPAASAGGSGSVGVNFTPSPHGVITEFAQPTAAESDGITPGPDGNLWLTEGIAAKIARLSPSGVFTEFAVPNSVGAGEITTGSDGNLWFAAGQSIGRVTPSGTFTLFAIPTAVSNSSYIAAGPDGNLWFTEPTNNKIGRLTTAAPSPSSQSPRLTAGRATSLRAQTATYGSWSG